jgi:hypothetical protein
VVAGEGDIEKGYFTVTQCSRRKNEQAKSSARKEVAKMYPSGEIFRSTLLIG